ncbi:two-component sensor histidine kinase [Actinomadura rubrobrunea]|uniref:histidine kinase n=1 Tax=Actinomadura rubrobrunea TaxID=115335 RepID=A0A9W6PNV9_9ACTN|nr:two-component sensor histidine kinase [Actinomadura rubrobrunea]
MWVVPLLLAIFQVGGSFGAQGGGGGRGPQGGPWGDPHPFGNGHDYPFQYLDGFGVALLLAGPAMLLLRRRRPVLTLAVVGVITGLYFLRAYTMGPAPVAMAVALLNAVVAGHRVIAWGGAGAAVAGYFTLTAFIGVPLERRGQGDRLFPVEQPSLGTVTFTVAWALVVLTAAELIRMRGQKLAAAARTRAEEEKRQASEERLRIARELHDVLAHNISMINVQAGVALHLIDGDPGPSGTAAARTALTAIKEASKEALTEMRSVIGVLRAEGESAPRSPTAGLDRLEELLDRARSAGLDVRAEITGERRPLPAGTDLAAYRIVQESLTNVSRHAGPGPVTVRVALDYGEREIRVRVEDDGRGVSLLDDHAGGSGIRGMRERAAALGGTFAAGPGPSGGFRVRATLPITEEPAPARPAGGDAAPDPRAAAPADGPAAADDRRPDTPGSAE